MAKEKKEDGRKSPENIARLKEQGFKKGTQRHPDAGRKKEVKFADYVKDLMAEKVEVAVAVAADLVENAEKESVRLDAAKFLLSPFVGKAPKQINIEANLGAAELLRLATSEDSHSIIDITPVEPEDDDE